MRCTLIAVVAVVFAVRFCLPLLAVETEISFAHDIRPILSEHCFHCHGPDAEQREAELRLDLQEPFLGEGESTALVVGGDAKTSELFVRVSTTDEDLRMPPMDSGRSLTSQQVELIRKWIEQGAEWQPHWAFLKPEQSSLPQEKSTWARNAIDRFVEVKLAERSLRPSAEAGSETLIRRVSLDLTGLPPTPEEVDRFLADDSPGAYERVVDRLLASPRYGERMAAEWLDAARYADTYGYQDDGDLSMWRWRDWVIEAFNANMPFDQFTIEQLAGDLLPEPTLDQLIATGFNRNHRHNSEGGAIPEEFRVEYVVDRLDTTATVWLGMTMICARCHDHKYDPITQKEFYELYAFFNNLKEDGRARKKGNTPPMMAAPTRTQQARVLELEQESQAAKAELAAMESEIAATQRDWEKTVEVGMLPVNYSVQHDLEVHLPLDGNTSIAVGEGEEGAFQLGEAKYMEGPIDEAAELDGERFIGFGDIGSYSSDSQVTLSVWVRPTSADGAILSKLEEVDDPKGEGYSLTLQNGKLRVYLIAQWVDDAIRVVTQSALPLDRWTHVAVTYDGLSFASGVKVYFDGKLQPMDVELDTMFQGFANEGPLRIGMAGDPTNRFHGGIDEVRLYEEVLTADEIAVLTVSQSVRELLELPTAERTVNQEYKLRRYFVEHHAPDEIREAYERVEELRIAQLQYALSLPLVMIMQDLAEPRATFVLERGQYDARGETVSPDVPDVLPSLLEEYPRDRLGFARWLVDPQHPLTGRVTVNRLWQMSFYTGLVKTAEDFGSQGEAPTFPGLLDWLAVELAENDWDLKAMRRLIVTSATYRQQSHVSPELLARDPENRWLARGPRFRLPAEMIRDQALFVAGLLVEELGGPSVKPYQPLGLWEELSDDEYEQDSGEKLYRRSLYTFWKRTVAHPLMGAFDAANREICAVREGRTNTPLQALTLMNEEGLVEAARVLAERVLLISDAQSEERLAQAFRLVTARKPKPEEAAILLKSFEHHRAHFREHPEQAEKLSGAGEYPRQEQLDPVEVAAYATVVGMILNLDEVVTQH